MNAHRHHRPFAGLAAAAVAALLMLGTASAQEWKSVNGPNGKVSVQLPAGYSQIERTSITPVGKLTTVIQNYEDSERLLGFGVTKLPKMALMMGGEKRAFDVAKILLLNEFKAKRTGYVEKKVGKKNAGELTYTCDYRGSAHTGKALFLLVGQNLYTINALEPTNDSSHGQKLFASVRVR